MASLTTSIIWFSLLTLCLLMNLDRAVEARESLYFSRFQGNENSPNGGKSGVKNYKDNYGADGVRDVNNGFGSESDDGVGGGVGYGSGSGTAYEEPNNAYFAGSDGAYATQRVRQEGTGASYRDDSTNMPSFQNAENQENQDARFGNRYSSHSTPYRGAGDRDESGTYYGSASRYEQNDEFSSGYRDGSTNTMPSFQNAENQENQDARFGNRYSSHSTPYRGAGARDESGTYYESASRYEQNDEFSSGYGVRSGSNSGYDSSYNADSGYDRSFASNSYNPGSRKYDRNAYNSNMVGGGGYEHTGSGYGEYVPGRN